MCGEDKFYFQKDLNQGVGCIIIAIGAALGPWTWWLSLGACALLDYILYQVLPPLTVCYVCESGYRGFPVNPDHRAYDLPAAQTWEARKLNWRRLNSGPSADTAAPRSTA